MRAGNGFQTAKGHPPLSLDYRRGDPVDFLPFVYTGTDLSKTEISFRVSAQYPLWAEFGTPRKSDRQAARSLFLEQRSRHHPVADPGPQAIPLEGR